MKNSKINAIKTLNHIYIQEKKKGIVVFFCWIKKNQLYVCVLRVSSLSNVKWVIDRLEFMFFFSSDFEAKEKKTILTSKIIIRDKRYDQIKSN